MAMTETLFPKYSKGERKMKIKVYFIVFEIAFGKSGCFIGAKNKRDAVKWFRSEHPKNKILKIKDNEKEKRK